MKLKFSSIFCTCSQVFTIVDEATGGETALSAGRVRVEAVAFQTCQALAQIWHRIQVVLLATFYFRFFFKIKL